MTTLASNLSLNVFFVGPTHWSDLSDCGSYTSHIDKLTVEIPTLESRTGDIFYASIPEKSTPKPIALKWLPKGTKEWLPPGFESRSVAKNFVELPPSSLTLILLKARLINTSNDSSKGVEVAETYHSICLTLPSFPLPDVETYQLDINNTFDEFGACHLTALLKA